MMRALLVLLLVLAGCSTTSTNQDPLPLWNDGPTKQSILDFVKKVSDRSSPQYVAPADRIAAFDNDGTLWVEQPVYVLVRYAADQMKVLAPKHPEWKDNAAFQKVITGDADAVLQLSGADQFAVAFAVHSGMTVDEYADSVRKWLAVTKHPKLNRLYTDLGYEPMLELIAYLRASGFRVYSVTGAEIGFVRVANEIAFGIPPDHVIATLLKTKFDASSKQLMTLPDVLLIDDGDGKPISIQNVLGRRPIAAFGNSDGDLSMLQWTAAGNGARLAVIIHHDDADREFAYDRTATVGHLDKALDAAREQRWPVVSMKSDWKRIFADPRK